MKKTFIKAYCRFCGQEWKTLKDSPCIMCGLSKKEKTYFCPTCDEILEVIKNEKAI